MLSLKWGKIALILHNAHFLILKALQDLHYYCITCNFWKRLDGVQYNNFNMLIISQMLGNESNLLNLKKKIHKTFVAAIHMCKIIDNAKV